jgi:hypothetical protein
MFLFYHLCCRPLSHLCLHPGTKYVVDRLELLADALPSPAECDTLSANAEEGYQQVIEAHRREGVRLEVYGGYLAGSAVASIAEACHPATADHRVQECHRLALEDLLWCASVAKLDPGLPSAAVQPVTPDPEASALYAHFLRELHGNPFRPVAADPSWLTSTVVVLARQMYESRDFSAMPILADALQDAGCDNDDILNHCRDTTALHVRGCWVVDLVRAAVE